MDEKREFPLKPTYPFLAQRNDLQKWKDRVVSYGQRRIVCRNSVFLYKKNV
jgi:hypothetical protein